MTIKKAKEILSKNVLDLSTAGMDYMPMKTISIETFEIMNKSKDTNAFETSRHEKAYLIGLVGENYDKSGADLACQSFFVKVWHNYYYADFFSGAIEVIEALRTLNEYKSPFPNESVTITL